MNPTPIEILRQPVIDQEAIDADSAELLLATAPTRFQRFALRVEDWLLRREEAAADGEGK